MYVLKTVADETAIAQLLKIHKSESTPQSIRDRAMIVRQHATGTTTSYLAQSWGLSKNTIRNYLKLFAKGGIDALIKIHRNQVESSLKPFEDVLEKAFITTLPSTINHAIQIIKQTCNILLKGSAVRSFMKRMQMKKLKAMGIPAKANPAVQLKFHDEQLKPKLKEAKEGKRVVLFMDAAHFTMGSQSAWVWCVKRPLIRTPSGRSRFNVLGALNAITRKLTTVCNDKYITSIEVVELLKKLKEEYGKNIPITIILDNARYQRCEFVMKQEEALGIELLFLPTYSPNLNLIERYWKHLRKACLDMRYFESFTLFKGAIERFLFQKTKEEKAALASLLTLNFQIFSEKEVLSAA